LLQEEGEVIIKVYKGTLIKIIIMMCTETSFIIKTLQYSLKKVGMVHFDFIMILKHAETFRVLK